MPKPMLRQQQAQAVVSLNTRSEPRKKESLSQEEKMKLDRILRRPRSKAYMEAMRKLDAGGHVHNAQKVDEIIQVIRNEFPDIELEGILLGYVSLCYLGKPYEVHTLDMTGNIIEHYQTGQPLPGGMEKARSLAMRGGYDFIEVYVDCCRAVSSNGKVSVVAG